MSFESVLDLTNPQMKLLQANLAKILKAKNPDPEEVKNGNSGNSGNPTQSTDSNPDLNSRLFESILSQLKEKTGRESFSLTEMMNPGKTVQDHLHPPEQPKGKAPIFRETVKRERKARPPNFK